MNKLICIIFVVTACISCDPPTYMDSHRCYWYVKNNTSEPIIITPTIYSDGFNIINPGDSCDFYAFYPGQHLGIPSFEIAYDMWDETAIQNRHFNISSRNGKLLKSWAYTDKNNAGKQFFNESSWRLYKKEYDRSTQLELSWVFDFSPADILADKSPDNTTAIE